MESLSWEETLDELLSLADGASTMPVNNAKLTWLRWMHQTGQIGGSQDGNS